MTRTSQFDDNFCKPSCQRRLAFRNCLNGLDASLRWHDGLQANWNAHYHD